MIESVILGAIQGIAEWIPVSSEGLLVLVQFHFFGETSIEAALRLSLFLHLGTFLAAFVYFRKDVFRIVMSFISYRKANEGEKRELHFYIIATVISGVLGWLIFSGIIRFFEGEAFSSALVGKWITGGIGALLLITAILGFSQKVRGSRTKEELSWKDSVLLGIAQGFAVLPGLSRSGSTVAILLLRRFSDVSALTLSFIMSLPIVLAGNILLQAGEFTVTLPALISLAVAFITGLLTIHVLLRFARAVNFAWFVLVFGLLAVVSLFL